MKHLKLLLFFIPFVLFACSDDDDNKTSQKLDAIPPISLDASSSSQSVTLSHSVENPTVTLKDNAFWINNLKIQNNKVTFDVIENIYYDKGCRVDTIIINERGVQVGSIAVSQARNRISKTYLAWANPEGLYYDKTLEFPDKDKYDGLKNTIYVYNLEKTTGGKDSYKNYPAFAYCIDMNADPENNMEWYLPSGEEMSGAENRDVIFNGHVYWWNTNNFEGYGFPFGVGSGSVKLSKSDTYWVYAFNKHSKEK